MGFRYLRRSAFAALLIALVTACSVKNLGLAEVIGKLSSSGATVVTDGTMFPIVGGKDCVGATWLVIDNYKAMVLEYKDKAAADNAKYAVRNSLQSVNFLFAPAANIETPLPSEVVAGLQRALKVEK